MFGNTWEVRPLGLSSICSNSASLLLLDHLEHVGSKGTGVILPELPQDDLTELREEDEAVPGKVRWLYRKINTNYWTICVNFE